MPQEQTQLLNSVDDLIDFVHQTLCQKENLLADQFQLQQSELIARGRPCGLQFSLHGPRSIRLGAIWAADQNVLFFYDTRGERYLKVKLEKRLTEELRSAG